MPHVFKALQLLTRSKYVSRATFVSEIHIGEGAVKTLIAHLKYAGMIRTSRSGSSLTKKGESFSKKIITIIPEECRLDDFSLTSRRHNHAILLRGYSGAIRVGVEQRDYAIMYGADSAVTLLFKNNRFIFPGSGKIALVDDVDTANYLIQKLEPKDNDVIIITSSNDPFVSEISAKNAALWTIATYELQ